MGMANETSMRTGNSIRVTLNGESRELPAGMSVADLLSELGLHARTVVVEHNRQILARHLFSSALIQSGDTLELVHFVGGG